MTGVQSMKSAVIDSFVHEENARKQRQVIIQYPELLDPQVVAELYQRQLACETEGNFTKAETLALRKELLSRCIEIGVEDAVAEAQRSTLNDMLKAIVHRLKPHFHPVWDDSPFPEILRNVQTLAEEEGYDGARLDYYGEMFFSSARQAHQASRPRAVLSSLYWAFAFFLCSSESQQNNGFTEQPSGCLAPDRSI